MVYLLFTLFIFLKLFIVMLNILVVFIGGGLGSVSRFFVSAAFIAQFGSTIPFPYATLLINVVGSLLIGVFVQLASDNLGLLSAEGRLFFAVGFCGGFTTFSTFSLETLALLQSGRFGAAAAYISASLVLCIVGTAAGVGLTSWWFKRGML